jgi:hypothetical protein
MIYESRIRVRRPEFGLIVSARKTHGDEEPTIQNRGPDIGAFETFKPPKVNMKQKKGGFAGDISINVQFHFTLSPLAIYVASQPINTDFR